MLDMNAGSFNLHIFNYTANVFHVDYLFVCNDSGAFILHLSFSYVLKCSAL